MALDTPVLRPAAAWRSGLIAAASLLAVASAPARQPDPGQRVQITGELKQWHKVTLTADGPEADERTNDPNPFRDYRMTVTFAHESGSPSYSVPGYFAADGNAAETSATTGHAWRAHVSPDRPGRWGWRIAFVQGKDVAIDGASAGTAKPVAPLDALTGSFVVGPTDKRAPDLRARGRLDYVGDHYLRFAGTGEYFLKIGADAPETLLAYADFDDTIAMKPQVPLCRCTPMRRTPAIGEPAIRPGRAARARA